MRLKQKTMLLRAWKSVHAERERRQRQAAWRGLDLSHEDLRRALETSGPLRAIYEAGMQDYVVNGGDLDRMHSKVSLDMARRLVSMGARRPQAVNWHRYPLHVPAIQREWERAQQWHKLNDHATKVALNKMRTHPPGSPWFEAAKRHDEALEKWMRDMDGKIDLDAAHRDASLALSFDRDRIHRHLAPAFNADRYIDHTDAVDELLKESLKREEESRYVRNQYLATVREGGPLGLVALENNPFRDLPKEALQKVMGMSGTPHPRELQQTRDELAARHALRGDADWTSPAMQNLMQNPDSPIAAELARRDHGTVLGRTVDELQQAYRRVTDVPDPQAEERARQRASIDAIRRARVSPSRLGEPAPSRVLPPPRPPVKRLAEALEPATEAKTVKRRRTGGWV